MPTAPRPTREELLAVYRAGPEAVVALVTALLDRIQALEQANARLAVANATLEQTLATLTTRVKQLEDRLALDSHNSSQPPSSDRGRPAPRSLRPPPGTSGRRPGGQPGHPGSTLRLVDTPDRVVLHRPAAPGAGGDRASRGPRRLPGVWRPARRHLPTGGHPAGAVRGAAPGRRRVPPRLPVAAVCAHERTAGRPVRGRPVRRDAPGGRNGVFHPPRHDGGGDRAGPPAGHGRALRRDEPARERTAGVAARGQYPEADPLRSAAQAGDGGDRRHRYPAG